jgi:hypothetical protein
VNHHETAAADISRARIAHGHRKPGGHCGVDRIAATPQYVGADCRGGPFLRNHQAVFGDDCAADGVYEPRPGCCAAEGAENATSSMTTGNIQRRSALKIIIKIRRG